jgi:hypothetical protein
MRTILKLRPALRLPANVAVFLFLYSTAACGSDPITGCCTSGPASLRVVNALTVPVDVLIDGGVAIASLPAGAIGTAAPASGSHSLALRPSGAGASASQSITTTTGAVSTIAVVHRANDVVTGIVLDDTNSVVPPGATKVRVLHLAPSAGTLQVYHTGPGSQEPVQWQFPFDYQAEPTSASAPFYQGTVGSWEVRVWQAPEDSSGWENAPVKVVIPLASGEKKTVLILDKAGGGVRIELL